MFAVSGAAAIMAGKRFRESVMVSMKDIRAAAERIGRDFRPHKIILFGSYACGTPTADSDVDLLVILPFEGKPAYKATEIALKANPHFPMDLLARTPRQVRERLAMGDFFMRDILRKGKVLYASDNRRVGGQGGRRLRRPGTRAARQKAPRL
jgi:predicted nucleotidyltransferase